MVRVHHVRDVSSVGRARLSFIFHAEFTYNVMEGRVDC